MSSTIKFTAKVRRGLVHVYSQATSDPDTRHMRRRDWTPADLDDFNQALAWIDQEISDKATTSEEPANA